MICVFNMIANYLISILLVPSPAERREERNVPCLTIVHDGNDAVTNSFSSKSRKFDQKIKFEEGVYGVFRILFEKYIYIQNS